MRRAVDESGIGLERRAVATEIPLDELRDVVLNGDDSRKSLFIEDVYRVAVALGATDTFAEWFRVPPLAKRLRSRALRSSVSS